MPETIKRFPTHPGKILRSYWEDSKLTQIELAKKLGVSFQTLNSLINQKKSISPEMAIRLSLLFCTEIEFWLSLQNKYDVYKISIIKKVELSKIKDIKNQGVVYVGSV